MTIPIPQDVAEAIERISKAMASGFYVGEPGQQERDHKLVAQFFVATQQQEAAEREKPEIQAKGSEPCDQ